MRYAPRTVRPYDRLGTKSKRDPHLRATTRLRRSYDDADDQYTRRQISTVFATKYGIHTARLWTGGAFTERIHLGYGHADEEAPDNQLSVSLSPLVLERSDVHHPFV